jgi:hypothetical protein
MAERRMLTKKVTNHDNFTSLPATAQALYLHLVMNADDDGFCDQSAAALFRAHAKKKDLEALVEKRYLLRFDSGVMVIKHWRMGNTIRKDRYEPTAHQEEFKMLTVKQNGAYTMASNRQPDDNQTDAEVEPTWQPNGNQMAPQVRLGKDRIITGDMCVNARARARARETPKQEPSDPDRWEEFWNAYPRKSGGDIREACMEYIAVIDNGVDPETLISAAKALAKRTAPDAFRYLPSAEKWLRNKGWLENPEAAQDTRTNNIFLQMYEDEYGGDSR